MAAKTKEQKDRPLMLRLTFKEEKGGPHSAPVSVLDDRYQEGATRQGRYGMKVVGDFPPRHEFSTAWILENLGRGFVEMGDTTITLKLDNGTAEYRIAKELMQDEAGNRLSTGYWGILVKGSTK